jgi:hypothetical protein
MPKREKDTKHTSDNYRGLIEEHDVFFDGPVPPSCWPTQYADIFRNIRDIERLRFDEYGPNENRGTLSVAEMKDRVVRLIRIAYNCLRQRENEPTWRGHTEPEVISRFNAEVVW